MTESAPHVRIIEETSAYWKVLFENPPFNIADARYSKASRICSVEWTSAPSLRVAVFESANREFYRAAYRAVCRAALEAKWAANYEAYLQRKSSAS